MCRLDIHYFVILWVDIAFAPTAHTKLFIFLTWRALRRISVLSSITFEIEILVLIPIVTIAIAGRVALEFVQKDTLLLPVAPKVSTCFDRWLNFGALLLFGAWLQILFPSFEWRRFLRRNVNF